MPAHYTVVQYVPDPIADERINVGVIVVADGQIRSQFLKNWNRVRRFAQEDIEFVREFADWVARQTASKTAGQATSPLPGFHGGERLDEQAIHSMAAEWSNSIQLTPPQLSLDHPDSLLLRMAQTFLREPQAHVRLARDHQAAARFAVRAVRDVVRARFGELVAEKTVHARYEIGGRIARGIRVDLAITNGKILAASQDLSFETANIAELDLQMRDAVYTLRDIGELNREIRRDIAVLLPNPELPNYRKAEERFRDLRTMTASAEVGLVVEQDVPEWAEQLADLVGVEIAIDDRMAMRA